MPPESDANSEVMSEVAVFGDNRGLLSQVLNDSTLYPIKPLQKNLRDNLLDKTFAICRPRAKRQAEYFRRQFKRSGSQLLVSLIDNVEFLGILSNPDTNHRTVAIQNGVRLPDTEWLYSIDRFKAMNCRHQYQHDIFLTWGEWDAERYLQLGGSARELIAVGSLADSIHRAKSEFIPERHQIGVLEMRNPRNFFFDVLSFPPRNRQIMSDFSQNVRTLYSHLERFCRSEATQPLFVLNSTHELAPQLQLLDGLYPNNKKIHYDALNTLASYDGVMSCHVVVGVLSSLLVEVLGRGRKILAFNPSGNADLDFPIDGIWTLRDSRYEAFEERLRIIIEMSASKWDNEVRVVRKSLIAYDPQAPTDVVIRKLVNDLIAT